MGSAGSTHANQSGARLYRAATAEPDRRSGGGAVRQQYPPIGAEKRRAHSRSENLERGHFEPSVMLAALGKRGRASSCTLPLSGGEKLSAATLPPLGTKAAFSKRGGDLSCAQLADVKLKREARQSANFRSDPNQFKEAEEREIA